MLHKTGMLSKFRKHFKLIRCCYAGLHDFVPQHRLASDEDVSSLQTFISCHRRIFILTGAGVSTESGIPDYRSKGVGLYDRSPNRPVVYKDFISSDYVRRRYWVRNFVGWVKFSGLKPNEVHVSLANWEKRGIVNWLVTQNVDKLHHKAGSEHITELHGSSFRVKCLNCNFFISRFLFQKQLTDLNPNVRIDVLEIRPDGDVEIDLSMINNFNIPSCERCGGILKPDVIFFGETVPKDRVQEVHAKVLDSDAVLVLGSSLEVYSGYRFILAASEQKKCIGIVNIGPTRADNLATFKLEARCGDILPRIKFN